MKHAQGKRPARKLPASSIYARLQAGMRFTVQGSTEEFVKIGNSNAISNDTGKDAIFALHDRCKPLGLQTGYYPVWNWL